MAMQTTRHSSWQEWIRFRELHYSISKGIITKIAVKNTNSDGGIKEKFQLEDFIQRIKKNCIKKEIQVVIHPRKTTIVERKYNEKETQAAVVLNKNVKNYLYNVKLSRNIINYHLFSYLFP